jgi:RNA polymerase sigma factor (sigma-70 family)
MPMNKVAQYVRSTEPLREQEDLTDRQLLDSFLGGHDPAAVEALVRRHGPMVWGVCRRIVGNHHDAEDAYQATFLVLVRKAVSIVRKDSVGNYLYGVARQTALKARSAVALRRRREMQQIEIPEQMVPDNKLWDHIEPWLDEELGLLPDRYREVIVLCDLEGKTRQEAARILGCPEGTIASRLARGRTMLARRLSRHGLALPGLSLGSTLVEKAGALSVPSQVMCAAIKATTLASAGSTAGVVPPQVAALTDGVLRAMLLTKLKVGMLIVASLLATFSGVYAFDRVASEWKRDDREQKITADDRKGTARKAGKADEDNVAPQKGDAESIRGHWKVIKVKADGKFLGKELSDKQKWTFGDKTLTITYVGEDSKEKDEASYSVDPKQVPPRIDLAFTTRPSKRVFPGIYKLEGNKLTVTYSKGEERPRDLQSPAEESGSILFELERENTIALSSPASSETEKASPPKKLEKVPAPSPELAKALYQLDVKYRGGTDEMFAELEEKGQELAKQFSAKDDQARIWGTLAMTAGQSGIDKHAAFVTRYGLKCLELSRDPLDRSRMYSLLASAEEVGGGNFEKKRREAGLILLRGYREMLAQELPEAAPELPQVERIGDINGGAEEAQARARHALQLAAREAAQFIRAQVEHRDTLVLQLRGLYKPDSRIYGRTDDGPEKLRKLAAESLTVQQMNLLLKKITE